MKFNITYNPPDEEGYSDDTTVAGFSFKKGETYEFDGAVHRVPWILQNNPHFTVVPAEKKKKNDPDPSPPEFTEPGAV